MKRRPAQVSIQAGKVRFRRTNAVKPEKHDLHRTILALSWPRFILVVMGAYFALNIAFAGLYLLGGDCLAGTQRGSLSDAFFYSVQTLSTVGYGHLYPANLYADIVTTLEIITGMFFIAVLTGMIFVRFSRPVARLLFSEHIVICPFDGKPSLQLRVANLQRQAMVEAEFRVMLMRTEFLSDGEEVRRFYPLKLDFDRILLFPAVLTIRHIIDENSPLHGVTPELFQKWNARVSASVVCIDTVIPAPVQSQADYMTEDVLFGRRFVEIYTDGEDGALEVDYGRVHDTEAVG